ncbi:hypothetical protein HBI81_256480 [Parastagonospora nodorum]|nr:hypothetical protein HBI18_241220 [Parastagonospora nodorum]KAH6510777.1 hypothetical protein HBI81_256480 [Parastagonospora nodorum]
MASRSDDADRHGDRIPRSARAFDHRELDADRTGHIHRTGRTQLCIFSQEGIAAGTKLNSLGAVLLGQLASGKDIWAMFQFADMFHVYVDEGQRAIVELRFYDKNGCIPGDRWGENKISMADVRTWDEGIKGSCLAERYMFVYDVLVKETGDRSRKLTPRLGGFRPGSK